MTARQSDVDTEIVHVTRLSAFRWQAWSPALVNPRYGVTASSCRRKAESDLGFEWTTGRVPRAQRRPV